MKKLLLILLLMAWASVALAIPGQSEFGDDPGAGGGVGSAPASGGRDTTFALFCQGSKMISWEVKATSAAVCSLFIVQVSTDSTNWFSETAAKDSTLTQTLTGALLGHSLAIGRLAVTVPQALQGLGGAAVQTLPPYIPWRWARAILVFYSLAASDAPAGVTVLPIAYYDNDGMNAAASRAYRPDR